MLLRTNPVNVLWHFAMAAVASLHCVGGRWKEFVVEKRQRLVEAGRWQPAQDFTPGLEAADAPTQPWLTSPRPCRGGNGGQTSGTPLFMMARNVRNGGKPRDPLQGQTFCQRQRVVHEEMPMLKEVGDSSVASDPVAGRLFSRPGGRSPAFQDWLAGMRLCRTLAAARRIALVRSLRTGNARSGADSADTVRSGSGYSGEASVVTPRAPRHAAASSPGSGARR